MSNDRELYESDLHKHGLPEFRNTPQYTSLVPIMRRQVSSRGEPLDQFDRNLSQIQYETMGLEYVAYSQAERLWFIDTYMWEIYCMSFPLPLLEIQFSIYILELARWFAYHNTKANRKRYIHSPGQNLSVRQTFSTST